MTTYPTITGTGAGGNSGNMSAGEDFLRNRKRRKRLFPNGKEVPPPFGSRMPWVRVPPLRPRRRKLCIARDDFSLKNHLSLTPLLLLPAKGHARRGCLLASALTTPLCRYQLFAVCGSPPGNDIYCYSSQALYRSRRFFFEKSSLTHSPSLHFAVGNIVAELPLERSLCSVFPPACVSPSSATGGGEASAPPAAHPEKPERKRAHCADRSSQRSFFRRAAAFLL